MRADTWSAFFWSLFSAGAFIVALLLPVHILLLHFGPTLGIPVENLLDRQAMTAWLTGILPRIYVFVLIGGALFHAAHRFKYVLFDWGMTHSYRRAGIVLYGIAILGTGAAFAILLTAIVDIVGIVFRFIFGGG